MTHRQRAIRARTIDSGRGDSALMLAYYSDREREIAREVERKEQMTRRLAFAHLRAAGVLSNNPEA